MGNVQSPPSDPQFSSASRAFTQKELEDLNSLFTSLAVQSNNSNSQFISLPIFQRYFGLNSGALGERLFDLITRRRKDHQLTFQDLVIAKASYEKGTNDEIDEFIYQLLDIRDDGIISRSDVESVILAIFDILFGTKESEPGACSRDILQIFLDGANFSKNVVVDSHVEKNMSFEDMRSWFALVPSMRKFLGSLLAPPDSGRSGSQVPHLSYPSNVSSNIIVLKREHAWHIGGALPDPELEEWKLLYHSSISGQSFNTFLGSITNNQGPTVLIIKDKEGYIYGGYASQPWERHSDFYGDMKSFLFQVYPKVSLFKPTGANRNLQWCAVNFSSEDIPNGIGFGGRINHFGLFISASFDQGQTFACTTFGSPCLSQSSRIYPEAIECWGVVQNSAQAKQDAVRGTILERFKEDRQMLNMVGIANSSE